jgi:MoaA/NifB/PqqE/SkfB family radical SAM enzyme
MLTQFDYTLIDEYQIEITSYCNAACPQCPRNDLGHGINPFMPLQHLNRMVIDKAFPEELCQRLRQVFFCGSYGDPIMHPNFLDILRDFRSKNPKLWLYIHTNGGVHDTVYWSDIADIMSGHGQIDFGIDGLEDTLDLYRQNVVFDRVINNARAFIKAGGRAQWNFIVFEHNEHQVEIARSLSEKWGFYSFLPRNTGRFFNHATMEEMLEWPVKSRQSDHVLKPPRQQQYRNRSMIFLPQLKKEYVDMREYFDTTTITCDALMGHKVAINVEGLVLPCNFFNHNLYDRRFYDKSALPGASALSTQGKRNQVRAFLESHGLDTINIHHRDLKQVFESPMWKALVDGWSTTIDQGRMFECAMTCGSQLTKVWDQGGNKR